VNGTTLLLTAHPTDPARRAGISLFRANFQSASPPLLAGEMGARAEAEKLLCMVLGLGFTPTAIQTNRTSSAQATPLLTIQVTAKSAMGEERVFTDTAAGEFSSVVRLFSSRLEGDKAGAEEIASIIQSLGGGTQARPGQQTPGTPRGTAKAAPGETSKETAQTVSDYHDALLMVEGQTGAGSGFLCKLGGQTVAITNAHVVGGNPGFKITDLKSAVLSVAGGAVSVDHDIVKLQVASTAKCFEVMDNLDVAVKIGDSVTVLGNAEGARVVKPVEGKVVGIGPNLVEVDAPFVPGNSGSPIVHQATGKVLGVATYLIEKKVKEGGSSVVVETRRFGYRLDSVKSWEPINWQRFYAQAAQVKKIDALSDDFIQLYKDFDKKAALDTLSYQSPALQRAFETFLATLKEHEHSKISQADRQQLVLRFLGDLRSASHSDILEFDSRNAYDYFRREVQKQTQFRDSIYNDLTRAIEDRRF
jgi:hypothetical protein